MSHASSDNDGAAPAITGINVTPLVDVTFVLLIVFMVTAKVIVSQAIPMPLPRASTPSAVQTTLAVVVSAEGKLTLDGAPMADGGALARAIKARVGDAASAADAHAVIAADQSAKHGAVIGAVDALRTAGVTKIAFAVDRKK
jgi:biopolymer transport protein ExbD